jgi:hypothetical protein
MKNQCLTCVDAEEFIAVHSYWEAKAPGFDFRLALHGQISSMGNCPKPNRQGGAGPDKHSWWELGGKPS